MTVRTDISPLVASHVASARYEDLPADVVAVTKSSILDGIGVILAASGLAPETRPFVTAALHGSSGRAEATVLGHGRRAAAAEAAFANGAMSHALDYEDAHVTAPVHANAAAIPAVLALAEAGHLSGRAVIAAIAVGCDLASRLGLAVGPSIAARGWYPPPILSTQGAVAAAANLIGLDEQAVRDAMSIAALQIAPSFEIVNGERSVLRSVREAFCARAAVVSARLAGAGVAGGPAPLDGEHGLLAMFAGEDWDADAILGGLGERYEGLGTSFKPWPSCRGTHAFVDGVLRLRRERNLQPTEVEQVTVTGGPIARMLAEPPERKRAPRTAIDAKFSLPFTVATAIVHGEVVLDSFAPGRLADPQLLAMTQRVRCDIDERRDDLGARVAILTRDGAEHCVEVGDVPGDPGRPLAPSALQAKFRECASHAAVELGDGAVERIIELVATLEDVPDVAPVLGELLVSERPHRRSDLRPPDTLPEWLRPA